MTWPIWKSLSAKTVTSFSFCSMRAEEPLKSNRVPISLAVWSTAFFYLDEVGFEDGVKAWHCEVFCEPG